MPPTQNLGSGRTPLTEPQLGPGGLSGREDSPCVANTAVLGVFNAAQRLDSCALRFHIYAFSNLM